MEKIKLYKLRSIRIYEAEELGLGEIGYYQFSLDRKKNKTSDRKHPITKCFRGKKNDVPPQEPIFLVSNDVRNEHQFDESISDEDKENMPVPGSWRMPLIYNDNRYWLVREDLFKVICETITVGEYEVYEAQIYNSHLNKTFTNYKIIHVLNIEPNMVESEFEMMTKGWKVPTPKFRKMKFDETDFKEVLASKHLFGGPFVTEGFKNKLKNFSKELCFEYMDYDESELDFNVYS